MQQYEADQRRRQYGPDRRSGIDDAHGGRTMFGRNPFGHDAYRGRKSSALAHAQQEARTQQQAET